MSQHKLISVNTKKEHFVPKSILRRFSRDSKQKSLFVFDKECFRSFPCSISDAGSENYFNSLKTSDGFRSFESVFENNDNKTALILSEIINQKSIRLNQQMREELSLIVSIQLLRTKLIRSTFISFVEQLNEWSSDLFGQEMVPEPIPTENEAKLRSLELMVKNSISSPISSKELVLFHSPTKPFWISDNPIVVNNSLPYGDAGLGRRGTCIYFPISKHLLLGFMCPHLITKLRLHGKDHGTTGLRAFESELLSGVESGTATEVGHQTTDSMNTLQVLNSERFIYASSDNFKLIVDMFGPNPVGAVRKSLFGIRSSAPKKPFMPKGVWVVLHGTDRDYMILADKFFEESPYIDFITKQTEFVRKASQESHISQASLFVEQSERRHMKNVALHFEEGTECCRVTIKHSDPGLNKILEGQRS